MLVLVSAIVTIIAVKNVPTEKPKKEEASDFERFIRGTTFVLAVLSCIYAFDANNLGLPPSHIWISSCLICLAAVCTFATAENYIYKKDSFNPEEENYLIGSLLYQSTMIFLVFVAVCTHLVRF